MKKPILTIIICTAAMGICQAQYAEGTVLQPTNVVARRYDASGQIVKEMTSTYSYAEDGRLSGYDFPGHGLWSTYSFNGDTLVREYTRHEGGHPIYGESFNYIYENNRLKSKTHLWDQMNASEFWMYEYDSVGRLERTDYKEEYDDDYHVHYLYEYEDEGRTIIENHWTSWSSQGMLLRKKTVFQYDDASNLLSEHAESYSVEGELTKATLKTYCYTPSGKVESEVTQTLTDGEWVNTGIVRYVLDGNDRVSERQVGEWSGESGEWNLTSKTVYELDEEALTLTVSFYKKNGEEWGWDDYGYYYTQPVFYEPYHEEQQHALRFYGYDDMFDSEHISQFVFTLAEMNDPGYTDIGEKEVVECNVYPNPTTGQVTITGKGLRQAEVVNTLGQRIITVTGEGDKLHIDMNGKPAGIYLVTVTDAEGRKCVKKVEKE